MRSTCYIRKLASAVQVPTALHYLVCIIIQVKVPEKYSISQIFKPAWHLLLLTLSSH